MVSDSKRRADRKWRESAYDKICIQLPRGTRDCWKRAAADRGLSLAAFVALAVAEFSGDDSREHSQTAPPSRP